MGMVYRVVQRDLIDDTVELLARQIAQAPLTTLMGTQALVKQAWEQMGMRVHPQNSLTMMELMGALNQGRNWIKD